MAIMRRQGRGAVVNIGSVLGQIGMAGTAAYSASKAAVEGLTRTAAIEVAAFGVRVNAVCPALIQTPMTQACFGGADRVEAVLVPAILSAAPAVRRWWRRCSGSASMPPASSPASRSTSMAA